MTATRSDDYPPDLLTVVEVAAALRVSRATVYRLIHAGALQGVRIGKSVRVTRGVVADFLHDAGTGRGDSRSDTGPTRAARGPSPDPGSWGSPC